MIIKSILKELQTEVNPIARSLHTNDHFKILIIGFKTGMKIKEFKTMNTSKLTVISGSVLYRENNVSLKLEKFDEIDIPADIKHSVEALEESLCLLTQGVAQPYLIQQGNFVV